MRRRETTLPHRFRKSAPCTLSSDPEIQVESTSDAPSSGTRQEFRLGASRILATIRTAQHRCQSRTCFVWRSNMTISPTSQPHNSSTRQHDPRAHQRASTGWGTGFSRQASQWRESTHAARTRGARVRPLLPEGEGSQTTHTRRASHFLILFTSEQTDETSNNEPHNSTTRQHDPRARARKYGKYRKAKEIGHTQAAPS